jgi:hypothetical protein
MLKNYTKLSQEWATNEETPWLSNDNDYDENEVRLLYPRYLGQSRYRDAENLYEEKIILNNPCSNASSL